MSTFSISILFARDIADALCGYSQSIHNVMPSHVVLGEGALPHLPLIFFNGSEHTAGFLWQKVLPILPQHITLHFNGLLFQEKDNGLLTSGVCVHNTPPLVRLKEDIGEVFAKQPHTTQLSPYDTPCVTLGCHQRVGTLPPTRVDTPLLYQRNIKGILALGQHGPEDQLETKCYQNI